MFLAGLRLRLIFLALVSNLMRETRALRNVTTPIIGERSNYALTYYRVFPYDKLRGLT